MLRSTLKEPGTAPCSTAPDQETLITMWPRSLCTKAQRPQSRHRSVNDIVPGARFQTRLRPAWTPPLKDKPSRPGRVAASSAGYQAIAPEGADAVCLSRGAAICGERVCVTLCKA